ncbi:hypothetical protein Csa_016243 [Cucumis sativus]|uniref:Uncharacterized protein n=1 Tax=Cucumis sativus TaxID=3659 RepID=A0A0A0KAE1_CUCSA|nr:hypothetical protein Csa_016243 [Cucumis sativus]
MCYPTLPFHRPTAFSFASHGRSVVAAVEEAVRQQRSGGGYKCICSPTTHPGSFKCRFHQGDYKWVSRSTTSKAKTNIV